MEVDREKGGEVEGGSDDGKLPVTHGRGMCDRYVGN